MGKGDKKSKRGKISMGSYGITRQKKRKGTYPAKPVNTAKSEKKITEVISESDTKKTAVKKAPVKKAKKETETTTE
ncbi:MAG TPA: 30S ribosomal protein THX [Bacteroidales bacterium]|nr:30S ribosomal protein THX [Bacteroidales bacterium]HPS16936.1 30S ribosomal protein THX [Bacteroidales bacterium]